jgi:hypothetical protein
MSLIIQAAPMALISFLFMFWLARVFPIAVRQGLKHELESQLRSPHRGDLKESEGSSTGVVEEPSVSFRLSKSPYNNFY